MVVNPAAGRGSDTASRVVSALTELRIPHTIRVSRSPDDIRALVDEGRSTGHDRFTAVGGDGTANAVLNALLAGTWPSAPMLGVIPAGSGSDFVRTFGIPDDIEASAAHLAGDDARDVDVGLLSGSFGDRYFLNAANAGIAARTVIEAERLPDRLGPRRYVVAFWPALAKTTPAHVHVDADGRIIAGTAWNVVIANGRYFGGNMLVAPEAGVGDGVFDVQVFSGPRRSAPEVIRRIMKGTHLSHRAVRRITGAQVAVRVPDEWVIEADGEIVGHGSFTVQVLGGQLRFKV